jgi:exodeoxyribonuclease V alpha subunit
MSATVPLLSDDTAALGPFVEAGVLDAAAVHLAGLVARTTGEIRPEVVLATALAARAPMLGHICVVPTDIAGSIVSDVDSEASLIDALPWPDPLEWGALLAASPAVHLTADPAGDTMLPLVWDGERLYLNRYWKFEESVVRELLGRAGVTGGLAASTTELDGLLMDLFGLSDSMTPDRQREAMAHALTRRLTVIAGGPGTGKTRTVALVVEGMARLAQNRQQAIEVALAAPTGKAAQRMTESIHGEAQRAGRPFVTAPAATTLHRLLGFTGGVGFRFDRSNQLPHDVVVVDETSMVSLPLMARLLEAVRPEASLILVGDPFQLASVEAGAALGEIVGTPSARAKAGPLRTDIVLLERVHRFAADSAVATLADFIREGDASQAMELLRDDQTGTLRWVNDADRAGVASLQEEVAHAAAEVIRLARTGDAAGVLQLASNVKVLCATRFGPLGAFRWTDAIESHVARVLPGAGVGQRWYVGRPIVVTRNDYLNRTFNGDVGVVVPGADRPMVAFADAGEIRQLSPSQLGDVETWWAATIHKSQGSEFGRVIVTLPPPPSPILTRELLYTGVTRAKEVTLVASEASLRAAIENPVRRASGLEAKLWPASH